LVVEDEYQRRVSIGELVRSGGSDGAYHRDRDPPDIRYVVSFRLIGLTRSAQPLAALTARSTPWVWIALCVLLGTGILLTITSPRVSCSIGFFA